MGSMISFFLAALMVAASGQAAPQGLVLITVDTLRADHLGFMGSRDVNTPSLDRLAESGAVFPSAYSPAPCTAPAHASLMTGLYPSFHGVGRFNGEYRLTEATPTLARKAREAGFETAAIVSNPMLGRTLGLDQGFDRYDDDFENRELNRDIEERIAGVAVAKALRELDDLSKSDRFFFWLHLQDPHGPYHPPEPGPTGKRAVSEESLEVGEDHSGDRSIPRYQRLGEERRIDVYRDRYGAEIEYLDRMLGPLLERLESEEGFSRTLVILTSDHGEAMGEDDFYFAHGHSSGRELLHVPLVLSGPGVRSGVRVEGAVSTVSIFATAMEVFGLDPAGAQAPSLLEILEGDTPRASEPVYGESHNQVAVASGDAWLRRDRAESRNPAFFARPQPDGTGAWRPLPRVFRGDGQQEEAALDELLDRFERESRRANEEWKLRRIPRNPSAEEIERLRALGYLE